MQKRTSKVYTVTLSPAAASVLLAMQENLGMSRSAVVEMLIWKQGDTRVGSAKINVEKPAQ